MWALPAAATRAAVAVSRRPPDRAGCAVPSTTLPAAGVPVRVRQGRRPRVGDPPARLPVASRPARWDRYQPDHSPVSAIRPAASIRPRRPPFSQITGRSSQITGQPFGRGERTAGRRCTENDRGLVITELPRSGACRGSNNGAAQAVRITGRSSCRWSGRPARYRSAFRRCPRRSGCRRCRRRSGCHRSRPPPVPDQPR